MEAPSLQYYDVSHLLDVTEVEETLRRITGGSLMKAAATASAAGPTATLGGSVGTVTSGPKSKKQGRNSIVGTTSGGVLGVAASGAIYGATHGKARIAL